MKSQTPIRSWRKLQLSLFSKGFLYAISSGVHLFGIATYFLILTEEGLYPFNYNNPVLWNTFYGFWLIIATVLFYHGCRTLYKFFHSLPDYVTELDNRKGYETDMVDRT